MSISLLGRILKKSARSFSKHHGFLASKALAFQALFCLVPTFLLILFLSSFLGVFQEPLVKVEKLITDTFVPHSLKQQILEHISIAFEHTQSLFTLVLAIFIISSFALISDIHDSFYQLSAKTERIKQTLFLQIILYIFIVMISFLMFISDFILGTILFSNQSHIDEIPTGLFKVISYVFTAFIIFSMYTLLSPIKINKKHALTVSLCISLFISLFQKAFLIYLSWFPSYMLIYGAIAILPIMFFWVYLHWAIVLYGYSTLIEFSQFKKYEDKLTLKNISKKNITETSNISKSESKEEKAPTSLPGN